MSNITVTLPVWMWLLLAVEVVLIAVWAFSKGVTHGLKKAWGWLRPDEPLPTAESIKRELDEATHA